MVVRRIVSLSFAYIAISAIAAVALFVIVMDVLKYFFGIDLAREELEKIQQQKRVKRRRPVIQKFVYVNEPTLPADETNVRS